MRKSSRSALLLIMVILFSFVAVFDAIVVYPLLVTTFLQMVFLISQILFASAVALLFWVWKQLGKFF